MDLDDFDRRILDALRADARVSNVELATRIGLSHSAISRRVKQLEDARVILGYHAAVDPTALGHGARAFVSVRRLPESPAAALAQKLSAIAQVAGVWILSGEFDLMIEIVASDMADYARVMLEEVQTIPGVASTRSMFVLAAVRER